MKKSSSKFPSVGRVLGANNRINVARIRADSKGNDGPSLSSPNLPETAWFVKRENRAGWEG